MDKKVFIALFLSFIAATIVGTLSHEIGHYIVAKYLGYHATISYGSTSWGPSDPGSSVPESQSFAIVLGGPVQTMLTGTIGLIFLYLFRKTFFQADELSAAQWLLVFVSLFWLRQTANFCMWVGSCFVTGSFSARGDEIRIANYLGLPFWSIATVSAIIGSIILALITFKFIPLRQRNTFLVAGLSGGIAGYYFWLVLFGKYILP